jgi:hypothetical protein
MAVPPLWKQIVWADAGLLHPDYYSQSVKIDFSSYCRFFNLKFTIMTTIAISGSTGETCKVSGVYYCKTHPSNTIPLAIGNRFPPCSWGQGHAAVWVLKFTA